MNFEERFLNRDNFYFAFKKLSYYLRQANEWYDPVELAAYEGNLNFNIHNILSKIKKREYRPSSIEPLPFPKKTGDDGIKKIRPYFKISLDDQLVWIAIINIIGAVVEEKNPFWSYGNRLYRATWIEFDHDLQESIVKHGSFQNSSVNLYRKWNQSWPLFRRHISMTIKVMSHNYKFRKEYFNDQLEVDLFDQQSKSNNDFPCYLDKNFWPKKKISGLHWVGLDFEKFYPSVNRDRILENLNKILIIEKNRNDCSLIIELITMMLTFPLNLGDWQQKDLDSISLKKEDAFLPNGLPTGLIASGFLANLALIDVDEKVSNWIQEKKNISVFKYVDDHVVLGYTQNDIVSFLNYYNDLLITSGCGVIFQKEKFEPTDSLKFINGKFSFSKSASTSLDLQFPEPLMTHTLKKVSDLNNEDYELATEEELEQSQSDLEHFLIADFADTEIRKDTRMSFAALKLCQLGRQIKPDFNNIDTTLEHNVKVARQQFLERKANSKSKFAKEKDEIQFLLRRNSAITFKKEIRLVHKRQEKIFLLLLKAARENPDKIKLWKRVIEFSFYSGSINIQLVFDEIQKSPIHKESQKYIYGYCAIIITDLLLKSKRLLDSEVCTFWELFTNISFVNSLIKQKNRDCLRNYLKQENSYSFLTKSCEYFEILSDFIFQNIREQYPSILLPKKSKYEEKLYWNVTEANANFLVSKHCKNEDYFWYLATNLKGDQQETFWKDNVKFLDLDVVISWSFLSLFPKNIDEGMLEKIIDRVENERENDLDYSEKSNFKEAQGILFEIFKHSSPDGQEKLNRLNDKLSTFLNTDYSEYLPLDQWWHKILLENENQKWIDPRLSEWTILEIIRQIAENLISQAGTLFSHSSDAVKIHPNNYLIPTSWCELPKAKLTWENWKKLVKSEPLSIKSSNYLIEDFRYVPVNGLWKINYAWIFMAQDPLIIIGLSVLMVQLFSRSFEWPGTFNKLTFIDQISSKALTSLESTAASSDTRILIAAIFSKKDIDIFFGSPNIKINDSISIDSLSEFVKLIQQIQERLEEHQLNLRDQAPRQLIFIDIDNLNTSEDKVFEKNED